MGIARLALATCAALVVACAAPVKVAVEDGRDFTRYGSWSWLPAPRDIEARGSEERLAREIRRLVERELAGRGLTRARRGGDLRIGVVLRLRREEVQTYQTGAVAQLSSMHSSPSYEVQSSSRTHDIYERGRLVIYAVDPEEGKIVWTGIFEDHFRGRFSPHLDAAISSVVGRFPRGAGETLAPRPPSHPFEPPIPTEITGPTFDSEPDVSS